MFSKFKNYSNWGQGDFRMPTSKSSAPNWNQMILRINKSNQDLSFLPVLISHRTLRHKTPVNGIKDAFPRFVVNTEASVPLSACLSVWEPKKNEEVEQRLQDAANPSKHLQIQIPPRAPTHLSRYLRASQAGPALTLILKLQNHVGEKGACV